uniref:Uncharacterized protein n=1 Tax=Anguilla anguilla TaxID=7936 RepID=A0A0E9P8C0_ANGAN
MQRHSNVMLSCTNVLNSTAGESVTTARRS